MASFNVARAYIGGRITQDPELKTTPSGISVCSFTVAVNRRAGKDGENKADFINCTAWRQTAEFISRYFKKASSIFVEGTLQQRSWETQDGQKRTVLEVQVDNAHFVDSKSEMEERTGFSPTGQSGGAAYVPDAYKATAESAPRFEEIDSDSELPF